MTAQRFFSLLFCSVMFLGLSHLWGQQPEGQRMIPDKVVQGEGFGYAVAMDDAQMIVSTRFSQTLYVFAQGESGWQQQQVLKMTDATLTRQVAKGLGERMALDGQTLAVAAPRSPNNAGEKVGIVAVYGQNGHKWGRQAILQAPDVTKGALFGAGLALDQGHLLVSAPGHDTETGQAWVYAQDGNNWTPTLLPDPAAKPTFRFGEGVALQGNWAAIGAPGTMLRRRNVGALHLYRLQADGQWSLHQTLSDVSFQSMGQAIAFAGNRMAVSAYDVVLIYALEGETWTLQTQLPSPDAGDAMGFGQSLRFSPDGQHLLIGSSGSAYLFHATDNAWTLQKRITQDATGFASSLALNTYIVLVNSPYEGEEYTDGAIYTYPLLPETPALIE